MLVTQSCPTLCGPMNCIPSGFSAHGVLQARILEWAAISFSRGSSQPRALDLVSSTYSTIGKAGGQGQGEESTQVKLPGLDLCVWGRGEGARLKPSHMKEGHILRAKSSELMTGRRPPCPSFPAPPPRAGTCSHRPPHCLLTGSAAHPRPRSWGPPIPAAPIDPTLSPLASSGNWLPLRPPLLTV